jgi:hypothetical protein
VKELGESRLAIRLLRGSLVDEEGDPRNAWSGHGRSESVLLRSLGRRRDRRGSGLSDRERRERRSLETFHRNRPPVDAHVELSGVQPPGGTAAGIHGKNFNANELDVDPLAERLGLHERPGGDERRE